MFLPAKAWPGKRLQGVYSCIVPSKEAILCPDTSFSMVGAAVAPLAWNAPVQGPGITLKGHLQTRRRRWRRFCRLGDLNVSAFEARGRTQAKQCCFHPWKDEAERSAPKGFCISPRHPPKGHLERLWEKRTQMLANAFGPGLDFWAVTAKNQGTNPHTFLKLPLEISFLTSTCRMLEPACCPDPLLPPPSTPTIPWVPPGLRGQCSQVCL